MTRYTIPLQLALAAALLGAPPASAAQGKPVCPPDQTLAVSVEPQRDGRAAPLVTTHELTLVAEWDGSVRRPTLSLPDGFTALDSGPRRVRLIVPAAPSLAVTASWEQHTDDGTCAASQTVTLPIETAKPPTALYNLLGRPDISTLAVVPDREAADLSPLEVSVRVARGGRFPSPGAKARTMSVVMRPSERVRYRKRVPSDSLLGLKESCRFYNLSCGFGPGRLFTSVDTLWGARYRGGQIVKRALLAKDSLPPAQPDRSVASDGLRVDAYTFTPNPVREPDRYEYEMGYDIQVHQSGRMVARLRKAVRCGKTPQRYYCHTLRAKNG